MKGTNRHVLPVVAAIAVLAVMSTRLTAQPTRAVNCSESTTVFQDVSRLGRKNSAAGNMSERHAEMAREGWRFVDMEVLYENADLEGFFLTYSRDASCPGGG